MKTALKAFALSLLISGSCGFATPPAAGNSSTNPAGSNSSVSAQDLRVAAVAIGAVVAYDYVQQYVLAPYVKRVPVIGGVLETVRNAVDIKKRN